MATGGDPRSGTVALRLGDGRSRGGVGLGLAVARGFTEAIGGELQVEDTPGGGTTMTFSFRVAPT
jgi:two-component system sensor histidine kinase KdpD